MPFFRPSGVCSYNDPRGAGGTRRTFVRAAEAGRMSHAESLTALRTVADYQFGAGAGDALFPPDDTVEVSRSQSGRPRQVYAVTDSTDDRDDAEVPGDRLVSYGVDGRFTLGVAGGRRLVAALDAPANRVTVGEESDPFVRDGRNAFAKFVRDVDPGVRPGDEVAVVRDDDTVIAVGRAELSADGMRDFDTGMAVKVREGAGEP